MINCVMYRKNLKSGAKDIDHQVSQYIKQLIVDESVTEAYV